MLVPPSVAHWVGVRSSQRESPCESGTQHWMSDSGSGTSAHVSTAHTPAPLSTPPAAAQAAVSRSSHSITVFELCGTQQTLPVPTGAQVSGAQILDILKVGVVLEHAIGEWLQEVLFQLALADRLFQRKRSDDAQPPRRVVFDASVECIDEGVGFAHPQRDTEHDVTRNGVKYIVNSGVDRINEEGSGHEVLLLHAALDLLQYRM